MKDALAAVAQELLSSVESDFEELTLRASLSGGGGGHRIDARPDGVLLGHSGYEEKLYPIGLTRPVVLELRIFPDGAFEAVVTEDVGQRTGHLPPIYTVLRTRPELPEPSPVSTLADVEAVIGAPLPPEVHELYASGVQIDGEIDLYPPDDIIRTWRLYRSMVENDPDFWGETLLYVGPPGAVQTVQFHPLWVPIASNEWGDNLCVDLAPGPNGQAGQIIQLAGEAPLTYLAESATAWAQSPDGPDHGKLAASWKVPDLGPDGVAALSTTLQKLVLHDPGDLDFGLLARLTSLRELWIRGGGSVRLGDLAHLPLESLHVMADEVELPKCETLRSLTVIGARVELPSYPNLRVLDVSGAEVDVESLPPVDHLTLNVEQWQRCSLVPAAASLTGESSLLRALAWARERGVDRPYEVISGAVVPERS
ncbi:SMI1/KNR4 family protein [Lentzea sp. NPDC058450]|uniref:SMI1/KNR4 family protein n=1 Tax=Lentzea sp. NPDC058450 TaxID=3346505 RepID=UPI00364DC7EB